MKFTQSRSYNTHWLKYNSKGEIRSVCYSFSKELISYFFFFRRVFGFFAEFQLRSYIVWKHNHFHPTRSCADTNQRIAFNQHQVFLWLTASDDAKRSWNFFWSFVHDICPFLDDRDQHGVSFRVWIYLFLNIISQVDTAFSLLPTFQTHSSSFRYYHKHSPYSAAGVAHQCHVCLRDEWCCFSLQLSSYTIRNTVSVATFPYCNFTGCSQKTLIGPNRLATPLSSPT